MNQQHVVRFLQYHKLQGILGLRHVHQDQLLCVLKCSFLSVTEVSKVSINNEINHVVSCTNIVTIAEPINTIIGREHSVKHEVLKVGQVLSGEEVCFVHTSMMAHPAGFGSSP